MKKITVGVSRKCRSDNIKHTYIFSRLTDITDTVRKKTLLYSDNYLGRIVPKPTKWHVRPAKTQLSLGIRLIRVFAVRLEKARILNYPLSAQRRLWSDWADAQAVLSLRWAHMPFCWFCQDAAHLFLHNCKNINLKSFNFHLKLWQMMMSLYFPNRFRILFKKKSEVLISAFDLVFKSQFALLHFIFSLVRKEKEMNNLV